ncbi:double-stranded RNA-binding protein 6-like [Tasmannia lanceolata]|uniref:double-stranded RNA-binding protein 6-like n=1 Tax=Tasmannia lanceolata TaxID=3420 RepID=UPI0040637DFA
MYKNQLQELAQRSCFNLPSYSCIREGPDHAPRFKSSVNFNGEVFESPNFCTTLRQAEHSAAEVALNSLSSRGPSHSLASRILDETGVYKNLLQEISQRVGAALPLYTTFRSGLGHLPVFTGTVELAGITFTGDPAKNKKQAEKYAAMAAWSSLKQLAQESVISSSETENNDELAQVTISRALLKYRLQEKMALATANSPHALPFPKKIPMHDQKLPTPPASQVTGSKILPLICPKTGPKNRPMSLTMNEIPPSASPVLFPGSSLQKFPAAGAAVYVPVRYRRAPHHGMAPPVTIRAAVPVFSASPLRQAPATRIAPPVHIRPAVPVFAAPAPVTMIEGRPMIPPSPPPSERPSVQVEEIGSATASGVQELAVENLRQLKI